MKEIMYDQSSVLIVFVLFLVLGAAIESGFRLGRRIGRATNESSKAQINTIQASLLGVLALLLGFTFSLSLQRYDSRSQAIINEANAIGTAMLRANLLPDETREQAWSSLDAYLDLRVRSGAISLDRADERGALLQEAGRLQAELWRLAMRSAEIDDRPVTSGLFIQALNEVIDTYGTRDAALNRHVPEIVLFLLFGTFALTAALVGYTSGVAGHRTSFATYILVVLIVMLVFIIIDLDRPRRGLISVSQQSLIDLQANSQALRSAR